VKIAATILPSMVLVKLVELIIYVDWLLHILRNLENPRAGLIYRRILDIGNFVVNHVSWYT